MPKFVIERAIAGIGASSASELQAISQKSCGVLHELGPDIQWIHSYVTGDKIYHLYHAYRQSDGGAQLRIVELPFDDEGWPVPGGP